MIPLQEVWMPQILTYAREISAADDPGKISDQLRYDEIIEIIFDDLDASKICRSRDLDELIGLDLSAYVRLFLDELDRFDLSAEGQSSFRDNWSVVKARATDLVSAARNQGLTEHIKLGGDL